MKIHLHRTPLSAVVLTALVILGMIFLYSKLVRHGYAPGWERQHAREAIAGGASTSTLQVSSPSETERQGGTLHHSSGPIGSLPSSRELTKEFLSQRLANLIAKFKAGGMTRDETLSALNELRDLLKKADRSASVPALLEFLSSGEDASTGIRFRVGRAGSLAEPPTMRVAALDWLGQVDATTSGWQARSILDVMSSADECALALRNVVWADPARQQEAYLAEKVDTLFSRTDWLQNPTAGFAESFDFAVYLGREKDYLKMAGLMANPSLKHFNGAAFVSMDWMTIRQPEKFLSLLADRNLGWTGEQVTRAELMARADPREDTQLRSLEAYFARPDITAKEAQAFANLFPNHNLSSGNRLATSVSSSAQRTLAQSAAIDLAALELLRKWEANLNVNNDLRARLPMLRKRLERHAESIKRASLESGFQPAQFNR